MNSCSEIFDPACSQCDRLAGFLAELREQYPDYCNAPVPAFGDLQSRLLIVGLAPGLHGANRSGRPFTGDFAGVLLYASLHACGFSDRPVSLSADDGLQLLDCRITNAVKCLPPANKPTGPEVRQCNQYLAAELSAAPGDAVILALGAVAHGAVLRAAGMRPKDAKFAHAAEHQLPDGRLLLDSYHCSRYNTQTGRLTEEMFLQVIQRARALITNVA